MNNVVALKLAHKTAERHLTIKTVYYATRGRKEVVRTTSAATGTNAVPHAVKHMRSNRFSAEAAEVYDSSTGALHAVIHRSVGGKITILFEREYKEGE